MVRQLLRHVRNHARNLALIALAAVSVFGTISAHAAFPERPITLIVPWAAGGGTDAVARQIAQMLEREGRLPDYAVACVGGGSNAMGLFNDFMDDPSVRLIGVEAAGQGLDTNEHAATLSAGRPGVLHGSYSYILQDENGQITETHSISAGLDYPGVGPEHSFYRDSGRAEYVPITDAEALEAFKALCTTEGIIPALESSHAIAQVAKLAPTLTADQAIVVGLSGRGDKDIDTVASALGVTLR